MFIRAIAALALAIGLPTAAQSAPILDFTGFEVSLSTSVTGPFGTPTSLASVAPLSDTATIGAGDEFQVEVTTVTGTGVLSIDFDPSGVVALRPVSPFRLGLGLFSGPVNIFINLEFGFVDPTVVITDAVLGPGGPAEGFLALSDPDPFTVILSPRSTPTRFPLGSFVAVLDIEDELGPITITAEAPAAAVPEPSSLALLAAGLLGVGVTMRRRARRAQLTTTVHA